jgi:hypothetical protein
MVAQRYMDLEHKNTKIITMCGKGVDMVFVSCFLSLTLKERMFHHVCSSKEQKFMLHLNPRKVKNILLK